MKKIPKNKTYSAIYRYIYGHGISEIDKRFEELNLDDATIKAWEVIKVLRNRKGYGWWFDVLESDLKNEIFKEIKNVIKKPLNTDLNKDIFKETKNVIKRPRRL